MKNNTIVTIGDRGYLWGIFLLIVSLRKNGMDEPVLVGGRGFTAADEQILRQLGDVEIYAVPEDGRSLTCCKAAVMLKAETEYITWVDGDGFFTGNCSLLLPPSAADRIHIRMRGVAENRLAFRGFTFGESGDMIPEAVLSVWRSDVGENEFSSLNRSCSACCFSLHSSRREFLKRWDEQINKCLPRNDVGVVDRGLKYYHQLDESTLNSVLCFSRSAPEVSGSWGLDKEPERMFVHFVGTPKPWQGWNSYSYPYFSRYIDLVEYAVDCGWELPSHAPYSLRRSNRRLCRMLILPLRLGYGVKNRLKRFNWSGGR